MIGKKETTVEKERLRMAGLCARSEQCEYDIRTKLNRTSLPYSGQEEVISFLKENRFIDERRFAGSFVRDKIKFAKWGKAKIKYHLMHKRISSSVITEALDEIDESTYMEVAVSLVRTKIRQLDLNSREDVARLYRSMMTRGFSPAIIKMSLQTIRNQDSE